MWGVGRNTKKQEDKCLALKGVDSDRGIDVPEWTGHMLDFSVRRKTS